MRFARFRLVSRVLLAGAGALAVGCGGDGGRPARKEIKDPPPVVDKTPALVEVLEPTPVVVEPPALVMPEGFEDKLRLGKRLASSGKLVDAFHLYDAAALQRPDSALPEIELARLFLTRVELPSARVHAEKSVALGPTSSAAWNTLGRVALAEKKLAEASRAFTRATEESGDNLYAWNNLGLALQGLERHEEAIEAFETAVAGKNPEPYMWNNLGMALEKVDRVEDARVAYIKGADAGSHAAAKNLARMEGLSTRAAAVDPADEPDLDGGLPSEIH